MSNLDNSFQGNTWRVTQKTGEPQPHFGFSQTHHPQLQQNPYARRQSTHPELRHATPPPRKEPLEQPQQVTPSPSGKRDASNDVRVPDIKIPYNSYKRAGPHNAKTPASQPKVYQANANVGAQGNNSHKNKLRDQFKQEVAINHNANMHSHEAEGVNPLQRVRERTSSLDWLKRKFKPKSAGGKEPQRPSSAPGKKQGPPGGPAHHRQVQPPQRPVRQRKPPVSKGMSMVSGDQPAQNGDKRSANVGPARPSIEKRPAPPGPSKNRDTTGTTWGNFLDRANQQDDPAPPMPCLPPQHQVPCKPAPSSVDTDRASNHHLQSEEQGMTKDSRNSSSHGSNNSSQSSTHSHKVSASKIIDMVTHHNRPRRNSDESDLSFMCSGVDDPALEVRNNPRRAAVIERQKEERISMQKRHKEEEEQRNRNNKVFAAAKKAETQRQQDLAYAEAEAKLEARLHESMHGNKSRPVLCERCKDAIPMIGKVHCRKCADQPHDRLQSHKDRQQDSDHAGAAKRAGHKRVSTRYDIDLSSYAYAGGDSAFQEAKDKRASIINEDLTSYSYGGGLVRPPSSIYPDDSNSRPFSGYADPGNPFGGCSKTHQAAPPVPPIPQDYRAGSGSSGFNDGVSRNTAFYRQIEEVHDMYNDSGYSSSSRKSGLS